MAVPSGTAAAAALTRLLRLENSEKIKNVGASPESLEIGSLLF